MGYQIGWNTLIVMVRGKREGQELECFVREPKTASSAVLDGVVKENTKN